MATTATDARAPAQPRPSGRVSTRMGAPAALLIGGLAGGLTRALDRVGRSRWLKPIVFVLALVPFAWLVWSILTGGLGANPIEALTDQTGELGLRFLILSLAVTPLRQLINRTWPTRLRRMLGLFAFFYAMLHVTVWSALDQQLDIGAMVADVLERPYIAAGAVAFLILLPLAATSTKRIARAMKQRWLVLHRLVYLAGAAVIVHYAWLAKGDRVEPYVYLAVLLGLFVARFVTLLGSGRATA